MADFEIVKFDPTHVHKLTIQSGQWQERKGLSQFDDEQWTAVAANEIAFTGKYDDRIVCIAGLTPRWTGLADAWLILDESVKAKELLLITRSIVDIVLHYMPDPFHRIQTTVRADWPNAHRWAEMLGFTREGTMRRGGPYGEDLDLYALVEV
jgi:hypothetical protein